MSPRIPRWTAKQLVRFLKKRGFVEVAQAGSHLHLRHSVSGRKTTVPVHSGKIIGVGLLKAVLLQCGLEVSDLNRS